MFFPFFWRMPSPYGNSSTHISNIGKWHDGECTLILTWNTVVLSFIYILDWNAYFWCSHSFEYLDQDETIICSMIGGIDACIKVTQGWPLADSPLKLISLKSSDHYTKGVSLSLICKVEVRWPRSPFYLFNTRKGLW